MKKSDGNKNENLFLVTKGRKSVSHNCNKSRVAELRGNYFITRQLFQENTTNDDVTDRISTLHRLMRIIFTKKLFY